MKKNLFCVFMAQIKFNVLVLIGLMVMSTPTVTAQSSFVDENNAYFGPTLPTTEDEANFTGAYYTGNYESPFKKYLGKTGEEIQKKLDDLWNHYFKGDNNSKVYYETNDGAYIEDINNRDVRSEGMSYGMMICVQTNHKEEFDKLWKWTKAHMWHNPSEGGDGYFSWSLYTNGSTKDRGCVPDGEIYFMMSLLLAANRWNDEGYMNDAQAILNACWKGNGASLFNEQSYVVVFQPTNGNNSWSDPSYSLPAYVDLFSRWSTTNKDKWVKATKATRDHLYKSSNTKSGLFSDYNNFDGTPHSVSFNSNATKYMYDAMRCAMNFGMDYYLFGADAARQTEMAKRLIDFFESDNYTHARFNWDGSSPSESYTTGEKGCNAVACYALMGLPEYEEAIKKNLKMAWDEKLMTGQYRYYDGLVHYLSMLHLCGSFKIWKGKLIPPTAKTELVYSGAKQDLVMGGSGSEENMIRYLVDGTSCGAAIPQGTDAKEYTVKWYASSTASTSLNTPEFSLTVTILPKTVSEPTIMLSQTSYDFDGSPKTPSVTVKDGETEIPAGEYTVSYENNTKVGKAKVTITDKEGGNYTVNGSIEFEIKTAEGSVTAPTAKTDLVYSGGKQDLITAGSSSTGTIQYSLDGTNYDTAIPQGEEVKEYTVYYKVVAKEGYKDVEPATVKVVISLKTVSAPTITLSQTSYDFDGTPKTPTVTVKDGETEIPAGEYTVGYENNTNVGTAKVTITDKEGGNYTVNGSTTFQITAAEGSVTAPTAKTGLVYNGGKQDLIAAGSSSTGTIQYSLDGTNYDTTIPQGKDAKEYMVYYKVVAKEGYKDVAPATVKVVISPKTVSSPMITLSQTSYDFDGTPKTPSVTVKDGETEIPAGEYTVSYENNTKVGTAKVTITDKEGGNYTVNGSTTFQITEVETPDDPDTPDTPDTPNTPITSVEITVSSAKQVAYCSDKDLDFKNVEGLKAYVATGYDKTTGTIWLTRVKDVPANTGFLIMGDPGKYEIPVKEGGSNSYYKNMFKGTIEGTTIQTTDGNYTNYYLSNGKEGVGFYKVTKAEGVSLNAHRAYLPIPTDIAAVGIAGGTETIKVSAAKQVPYYSLNSLDFTNMTDVKAYTATGYDYKTGTIWLTRVKKVPAETGILIMAEKGEYDVPKTSVASVYSNMFKGSLTASTIYTNEQIDDKDYINYYLSNGDAGVGFYKVTKEEGVNLGANRCYLPIPKQSVGTRGLDDDPTNFGFQESDDIIALRVFGSVDGTTDIETNNREPLTNNHWYNLQGQRVENPGKGLYIRNGRKIIVR